MGKWSLGEIAGGITGGINQGLATISNINKISAEMDAAKLRDAEMKSLMAPINPEEFEWWGETDEPTKKSIQSGLSKYGNTRYGFKKTIEDFKDQDVMYGSILGAQQRTAQKQLLDSLTQLQGLANDNTPEGLVRRKAIEDKMPEYENKAIGLSAVYDKYTKSIKAKKMFDELPDKYKTVLKPYLANGYIDEALEMMKTITGKEMDIAGRVDVANINALNRGLKATQAKAPKAASVTDINKVYEFYNKYQENPTPEGLAQLKAMADAAQLDVQEEDMLRYSRLDSLTGNRSPDAIKRAEKFKKAILVPRSQTGMPDIVGGQQYKTVYEQTAPLIENGQNIKSMKLELSWLPDASVKGAKLSDKDSAFLQKMYRENKSPQLKKLLIDELTRKGYSV